MITGLAAQQLAEAKALLAEFRREDDAFMLDDTAELPAPNYGQWAGRLANRLTDLIALLELQ